MSSESGNFTNFQAHANDWAELAKHDPEAFETMRLKLVNDFIKNSPSDVQRRLKGIQWKVEHLRRRAKSPTEAFIAVSGMMWDSAQQLGNRQRDFADAYSNKRVKDLVPSNSANILPFKRTLKQ